MSMKDYDIGDILQSKFSSDCYEVVSLNFSTSLIQIRGMDGASMVWPESTVSSNYDNLTKMIRASSRAAQPVTNQPSAVPPTPIQPSPLQSRSLPTPKFKVGDRFYDPHSNKDFVIAGNPIWNVNVNMYVYDIRESTSSYVYQDIRENTLSAMKPIASHEEAMSLTKVEVVDVKRVHGVDCKLVKNVVLGKEFLYCRTHDEEADNSLYCRKG